MPNRCEKRNAEPVSGWNVAQNALINFVLLVKCMTHTVLLMATATSQ